jgi:hypothetical protein
MARVIGLIKMDIVNQRTGETEHLYSRYDTDDSSETGEISLHRQAMFMAIEKRAEEFMPVRKLDTTDPVVV